MKLVECFETYQGEGPDSGRKMLITRFRECDRVEGGEACSWCDTLVKMRISCEAEFDIEDIKSRVERLGGLMITGGEPTYGTNLAQTFELLKRCNFEVCNIETNGYGINGLFKMIDELPTKKQGLIKVIYSPKMFTITDEEEALTKIKKNINRPQLYLKFVDDQTGMVEDVLHEVKDYEPRKDQIWIMPQGKSAGELIENSMHTMDIVEKYRANFSSRNHVIFDFV